MQALTNLDTSFLHIEDRKTPMHVGGVMLFSAPADSAMTFERFRRHVASRLQTARVFRQRLFMPPALLANPTWIEDPDFNLDNHLRCRVQIGELTHKALEGLSSLYFSVPLRLDQPLWQLLFVRTANPADGFAVLLKVHHCALDGVSAEAVITGLLDFTPEPRPMPKDTWQPEALPSTLSVIRSRWVDFKQTPTHTKVLLSSTAAVGTRLVKRTVSGQNRHLPRYFGAPRTPFNRSVSTERSYFGVQLSLSQIKAIKSSRQGLTVNDVVLAICAGATRRYLEACGDLPAESLVAMAPVSRRGQDEKGLAGNKVSSMLIKLATDIADPIERLSRIHTNAQKAKEYNRDVPVDSLMDLLPAIAPTVVLNAFSTLKLGRQLPPIFNMVITNVAGSPVPLYLDGAMMQSISGMAGITDGMALTFVIMSYRDNLSINITTTPEAVLKPARLAQYLQEAADELAVALIPALKSAKDTKAEKASQSVVVPIKKVQEKAA